MKTVAKRIAPLLLVVIVLAGCGAAQPASNSAKETGRESVTVSTTNAAAPTATVAVVAQLTFVPVEAVESFPTPDIDTKTRTMEPTAVIIQGAHPYPTANSAIDSNGDGFYTLPEIQDAIKETYPSYQWPETYHPTIEDVFMMLAFDMFPPGSTFEVPMELSALGNLHQCAWQQNWLDAFSNGDQAQMTTSMKALRASALTNPNNQSSISHTTQVFNKAELGDIAQLQRYQEQCVGFNRWVKSRGTVNQPNSPIITSITVPQGE